MGDRLGGVGERTGVWILGGDTVLVGGDLLLFGKEAILALVFVFCGGGGF